MRAAAKSIGRSPGRMPRRFPAPILALPTGVPTKPRVTPDRNERRIANGAELEKEHCSVTARGGHRPSVTLAKEPDEANFGFSRP
jgi:hypothetical protein